jgi:putative colanic acid biosysnthesis UDP-glucose lipid carrier transferase
VEQLNKNATIDQLSYLLEDGIQSAERSNPRAFAGGIGEHAAVISMTKRGFDIVVAGIALFILLPGLVIVAVLVRFSSPGPIFFRQQRTGYNGEPFNVLKFRTMYLNDDKGFIQHATKRDKRVTPIGGFLRATSIDELPQLINVLLGDMSLVGPRPHALPHDRHYGELIATYSKRFAVRPGITGLAQVRGLRGEIHDLSYMERRVAADCEYIESWTLMSDLQILLRTVPRLVRDPNAY